MTDAANNDRVALVTGASRGIGRAIASALAAGGTTVVGTATSQAGADAIGDWMGEAGYRGQGAVLDIASQDSVDTLMGTLRESVGVPLILVNNAGITRDNLLMRMKAPEWDDIIQTNLSSLYRMCKAVLRGMMKARYGRIVNIASVVGQIGNAGQSNYAAAKAGMIGFSRSLAREIGSRGITVNTVAPGYIATDMTGALDEGQREALLAQIPLGRLGAPEDIAAAVAYLVSDQAAYVTGETINVNGGMYMP